MKNKLKILLLILITGIYADTGSGENVYYFTPGPNLVSFNILPEEGSEIVSMFHNIEDNMISIINQGEVSYFNEGTWVGSLTNIDNEGGYWILVENTSLLPISGEFENPPLYMLMGGANLISYPYSTSQPIEDALPFYMLDKIIGIIGQNEAALFSNNEFYGSLESFEPNKGYWFILSNPVPFQYNIPDIFATSIENQNLNNEITLEYNQSTKQSIFFIENIYLNNSNVENFELIAYCDNTLVGHTIWDEQMSEIIIMGEDGFDFTDGYCNENDIVSIGINIDDEILNTYIIGNDYWKNNQFSTIMLSDFPLGDVNFDSNINITDIILVIDFIISEVGNLEEHQLLLSDVNQDQIINVTDIILLLENILD